MSRVGVVRRYVLSFAAVAAITTLYRLVLHVNPTTVALTLLLVILLVSAYWGFRLAAILAIFATAVFNFFFLPPFRTFVIADPQNWIALFVFLITALVASNLSERARLQAAHANQRRREVEQLYRLSQSLLTAESTRELLNKIPAIVVETFDASESILRVTTIDTTYKSKPNTALDAARLSTIILRGQPELDGDSAFVPLRIGMRTTGALAIAGQPLSLETLEAIGSLVGIAIERLNAVEELTKTRALQENEKLRSALLDSLTHEFRTPLTSIKASVTTMLAQFQLDDAQRHELLTVIDEESDRLNRLVGEAAEMSQLDSGMFTLEKQPHSLSEAIEATLEEMRGALQSHPVATDVPSNLPLVPMDLPRIEEVLLHLLQNAAKYSEPGTPIHISAELTPSRVICSVADRGSGIDTFEQGLIFDKFYRGRNQRYAAHGTGLGLAICKTIIEAHGGSMRVVSQPNKGSVFSFELPLA